MKDQNHIPRGIPLPNYERLELQKCSPSMDIPPIRESLYTNPQPSPMEEAPNQGCPILQSPSIPYNLSYPTVFASHKPISIIPLPIDPQGNILGAHHPTKSCLKRGIISVTSPASDVQFVDLTDERDPIMFKCAKCKYQGYTQVKNTIGPCTYISTVALCCCCPLFGIIPWISKRFQYIQHYCPNCTQKVAINYPA